ncbi:MAG TPA: prolyl oligopeptidase family serine peptidase [Vicinamibacterales bacterium]|nr:prolyl oligopeptidase family serine peptidase [Vicinamibacterales bacterium]
MPATRSYGTWPSPLSAQTVAAQGLRLSAVGAHGDAIYWIEGRPAEGGRNVLVRRTGSGFIEDVTPPPIDVRTRVHEYGGGWYVLHRGVVYVPNFSDQRIYRFRPGEPPDAITPAGCFYADAVVDAVRDRLIAVREDHRRPGEPVNELVAIPLSGTDERGGTVLASGYDVYSTPRPSPDDTRLAWLCWRHPQMPWDGTELWVADIDRDGLVRDPRRVAGGEAESIYQPGWSPDGVLYFASDRTGWWTLYRAADLDRAEPVLRDGPDEAEFGRPQWLFGTATWAFAGHSDLVAAYTRGGHWHLIAVDTRSGRWAPLAPGLEPHDWLAATPTHALLVAASAVEGDAVVQVDLRSGGVETVRASSPMRLDRRYISVPEGIEFPGAEGRPTYAFYYPPHNPDVEPPAGERPPLIVMSHGGPTAAAVPTLDLRIQFWTTRGFAVVDVNYGGSSGYGRLYRDRLEGRWGLVDVADVVAAARYLVATGRADPARLIIRGGSAGGYTTLAALTFHPGVFKAGASYYGVSDLEVLARDTHKFESRYLDTLIGPYPAARDTYRARSPIDHLDRIACPLILFQGLDDQVVPPNQSEMMAGAMRTKGLPVAYLAFEGEQHGFRKAETVARCLEAELYFYGAVLGFTPADPVEPVQIHNLPGREVGA